jgi:hypothetical protein
MANRPFRRRTACVALTCLWFVALPATGQPTDDISTLRQEMEELRRRDAETRRRLEELQQRLDRLQAPPPVAPVAQPAAPPITPPVQPARAADALDRAVEALGQPAPGAGSQDLWATQVGPTRLRLIDLSFDTIATVGTSTATDDQIGQLEGGVHDPQRRGFTLQNGELALTGAVDPYFTGHAYVVFTPDEVDLEEAFMATTALPYGLQAKAGYFLTEFGLLNPLHPHAWDFVDKPVIATRLFGPEALDSVGARLGWLAPTPWYSELILGAANANQGEKTYSFVADDGVGDRPTVDRPVANLGDILYTARWEHFVDIASETGMLVGVSGAHGPNNSGKDTDTWLYGADMRLRWRPADNFRGWPFVLWQTELMKRDYQAARFTSDDGTVVPGGILRDYGFYSQGIYGLRYGWAGGLRYEYATGNGSSVGGRRDDPYRDARHRVSPLLVWHPTEFSRFRLQYNYDNATHLPDVDAHSVWLAGEIFFGAHAAHKY